VQADEYPIPGGSLVARHVGGSYDHPSAGFDLCYLMKYVTRFTEEIFASFITITFILGALLNVLKVSNYRS